jgi:hypothetical protein
MLKEYCNLNHIKIPKKKKAEIISGVKAYVNTLKMRTNPLQMECMVTQLHEDLEIKLFELLNETFSRIRMLLSAKKNDWGESRISVHS